MAKKPDGVLNGFLDEGSHFKGDLTFDDTMRIDGKFEGTIRSDHLLIIGDTGVVDAEVRVGSVSIDGTLRGTVIAREKIEIHPHGRVFAKLHLAGLGLARGQPQARQAAVEPRESQAGMQARPGGGQDVRGQGEGVGAQGLGLRREQGGGPHPVQPGMAGR